MLFKLKGERFANKHRSFAYQGLYSSLWQFLIIPWGLYEGVIYISEVKVLLHVIEESRRCFLEGKGNITVLTGNCMKDITGYGIQDLQQEW